MTIQKCYWIWCDVCNGNQWEYSYYTLKKLAVDEFKKKGWRLIEDKATCPDCLARETMICPDCKGKLVQKEQVIQCENNDCRYYLANKEAKQNGDEKTT